MKEWSPLKHHLQLATYSGLLLSAALAHIDLFARLAAQKFQWYEFHLALLTPLLVLVPLFGLVALYLELTFAFRKKRVEHCSLAKAYAGLSVCTLLLMLAGVMFFSFQLSAVRGEVYQSQKLVFIFAPIITTVWMVLIWYSLARGEGRFTSLVQTISSNYLFFLSFALIGSLCADIYLLQSPAMSVQDTSASKSNRPNVILITLDTVRADHLSAYGYLKPTTPFLKEIAGKSVLFEHAQSTTSWTLPSHASLFTGMNIESHGATGLHQKLDDEAITLAEILKERGYSTAGFIGGGYCKAMYGLAQGFDHYSDRLDFFEYDHTYDFFSIRKLLDQASEPFRKLLFQNDGEKTAPEINSEIQKWLSCCMKEPFFLFANYFDAHAPYNLGKEYRSRFVESRSFGEDLANQTVYNHQYDLTKRYRYSNVSTELGEYIASLYDSEIRYLDQHLQTLFKHLDERGLLDNTLVVITADHGEEFLDHGGFSHSLTLFQEMLHVPLLISFPQKFEAKTIPEIVSITDVLPTLLDILGENSPKVDGQSLLPLLEGEEFQRTQSIHASLFPNAKKSYQRATIHEEWKLIVSEPEYERVPPGLFNLEDDPQEQTNKIVEEIDRANSLRKGLPKKQ